jgi:hypothetical protein
MPPSALTNLSDSALMIELPELMDWDISELALVSYPAVSVSLSSI